MRRRASCRHGHWCKKRHSRARVGQRHATREATGDDADRGSGREKLGGGVRWLRSYRLRNCVDQVSHLLVFRHVCDICLSEHADKTILVDDRQSADAQFGHPLECVVEVFVGPRRGRVVAENMADLDRSRMSLSATTRIATSRSVTMPTRRFMTEPPATSCCSTTGREPMSWSLMRRAASSTLVDLSTVRGYGVITSKTVLDMVITPLRRPAWTFH